jgi:hypothetical protein
LSCHDLYIRTLTSHAPTTQSQQSVYEHEPWMGEPPADFDRPENDDWLTQIESQLRDVEVLKLVDDQWLNSTGISDRLQPVIEAFRARGGRVEYESSQA